MIIPGSKFPNIQVPLINGTNWDLYRQKGQDFTLMVFYRGLHCPICKSYLETLTEKLDEFKSENVHVIAISCDTEERAKKAGSDWDISGLPIGYDFDINKAKELGLFISKAISDDEPSKFSEPGVFLIKPDNTLYASSIQTMPFARPNFNEILEAIGYIKSNDYPARGTLS